MHYTLFTLLLATLFISSCSENNPPADQPSAYTIHGEVANPQDSGLVILSVFDPVTQKKSPVDTAVLTPDGTYELSYAFSRPNLYRVDFFRKQSVMLIVDEGQSDIKLDVEGERNGGVIVSGSEDSKLLQGYEGFRQESYNRLIKPAYDAMRAATDAGDQQAEIDAVMTYARNSERHRAELIDYTKEYIGTSLALYGTMLRWTGDDQVAKLDELVSAFARVHPDLHMTRAMQEKVDRYRRVAIGAQAPEITLPNENGDTIALYDTLGTYTLIDFWASWCGPCLLQVPDLKQALAEHGEDGFRIYSVSADTKGDKWRNAITEYELNWPNVSDLRGWESEAANAYNATYLPYNLLIDSTGTIVAKNLHSKELQETLKELL